MKYRAVKNFSCDKVKGRKGQLLSDEDVQKIEQKHGERLLKEGLILCVDAKKSIFKKEEKKESKKDKKQKKK